MFSAFFKHAANRSRVLYLQEALERRAGIQCAGIVVHLHPAECRMNDRPHLIILAQVDITHAASRFLQSDIEAFIEG